MLKKIIDRLNSRKVKVFLLFLICSILAWSISKLSGSYESRATFELDYINFPDTLLLNTLEKDYTVAKVRASGFQFLGYGINKKKIKVDLQKINYLKDNYFLTETELKTQFDRQLSNTVSLLELEKDTFFVDLYKVILKEVPINPNVTIEVAPNHILEGALALNPKTATIKGPAKLVAKINKVSTSPLVLSELSNSFKEELTLLKPDAQNMILLQETVEVSGKVVEFSEREFIISVGAENIPSGYRIKTFPNEIKLVCKAGVDNLKTMKPSDFELLVDYESLSGNTAKYLNVQLKRKPDHVYSVQLLTNQVEFVLEKL